jgi:hypothetical protein
MRRILLRRNTVPALSGFVSDCADALRAASGIYVYDCDIVLLFLHMCVCVCVRVCVCACVCNILCCRSSGRRRFERDEILTKERNGTERQTRTTDGEFNVPIINKKQRVKDL